MCRSMRVSTKRCLAGGRGQSREPTSGKGFSGRACTHSDRPCAAKRCVLGIAKTAKKQPSAKRGLMCEGRVTAVVERTEIILASDGGACARVPAGCAQCAHWLRAELYQRLGNYFLRSAAVLAIGARSGGFLFAPNGTTELAKSNSDGVFTFHGLDRNLSFGSAVVMTASPHASRTPFAA